MKQHISINDLDQLSDSAKEKLRKWWKPESGDKCYIFPRYPIPYPGGDTFNPRGVEVFVGEHYGPEDYVGSDYFDNDAFPLLSIGQMIEFLSKHTHGTSHVLDNEFEKAGIYASRFVFGTSKNGVFIAYNSEELCDALWQAVKEVLEHESS